MKIRFIDSKKSMVMRKLTLLKCLKSSNSRQLRHFLIQPWVLSPLIEWVHSRLKLPWHTHCSERHGWKFQFKQPLSSEPTTALTSSRRVFSQSTQRNDIEANKDKMVSTNLTIKPIMISSPNSDSLIMMVLLPLPNLTLRTTWTCTNQDH